MKYVSLILLIVVFSACSKDELYGPFKLKNGQEVELLVDHRYGAENTSLLILPQNEPIDLSLYGFDSRKPGYTYKVKAKLNVSENPPQDGPDKWLDFSRVISEEKYQGNEAFTILIIKSYVPGGPTINLLKKGEQYEYVPDKLALSYANQTVKAQLEEIWKHQLEIRESWNNKVSILPKWKSIKATVTHDPNNFGKAYLVSKIEFSL